MEQADALEVGTDHFAAAKRISCHVICFQNFLIKAAMKFSFPSLFLSPITDLCAAIPFSSELGSIAVQLDNSREPSTCYGVNHPIDRSKSKRVLLAASFAVARRLECCGCCIRDAIFHPPFPRSSAGEVGENHGLPTCLDFYMSLLRDVSV